MSSSIAVLSLSVVLLSANKVAAAICYDRFNRGYYCNNGLAYGARIGIGIAVAAAVIILFGLCGFWRRRQIRSKFAQNRPPPLPYSNTNGQAQMEASSNPYANNPPPPPSQSYSYGGPAPPPQTYQPSMAGQYKAPNGPPPQSTGTGGALGEQEHEHGYEWEQAREQERLEREQAGHGQSDEPAPPGYDIATSTHNTGNTNSGYAPPSGPPPGMNKRSGEGTV